MKYNIKTGICANCGADEGLHHYDSERCPKNGIEEWRKGKVQQWENTRFEDSGIKAYEEKAISEYDKLKADNEVLLNALKVCGKMLDQKKNKRTGRMSPLEWEMYATVYEAINQVESK